MRRFVPVRMRVPIGRLAHATRLHVLNSPLILLLQSEILLQHGRHQLGLQLDVRRLGCLGLGRRRAAIRMAGGDGEVDFLPAEHAVRVRVEQRECVQQLVQAGVFRKRAVLRLLGGGGCSSVGGSRGRNKGGE